MLKKITLGMVVLQVKTKKNVQACRSAHRNQDLSVPSSLTVTALQISSYILYEELLCDMVFTVKVKCSHKANIFHNLCQFVSSRTL